MTDKAYLALKAFARKHGCRIIEADIQTLEDKPGWSPAPYCNNLAVHWEGMIVAHDKEYLLGELIHELGHVLACSSPPEKSGELNFFGWEWVVACKFGVEDLWRESCKDYALNYSDFGDLSRPEQDRVLLTARRAAVKRGLIKAGEPVSVRR